MPSFYIPNRYRTGEELAAYLLGCYEGLLGIPAADPVFLVGREAFPAYQEGYRKGASLRELDL